MAFHYYHNPPIIFKQVANVDRNRLIVNDREKKIIYCRYEIELWCLTSHVSIHRWVEKMQINVGGNMLVRQYEYNKCH